MNYSAVKYYDIANGLGVRTSLFVSGCRNHCKGCFQPETWDFCHGKPFDPTVENEILESLKPDYIKGLTLLGGDPFEPENQEALVPFLKRVKEQFPEKNIWAYTGYILDRDLMEGGKCCTKDTPEMLKRIDVLVDGPFVEEKKDITLKFKGSSNQRVIDYIRDVAEYIPTRDGKISATMMLERFLFDSAMQYAPIAKLSGGEKRRLYLLKVLMEAPNVLLLDEPSNDLDIPTLTILEDYLDSFAGIVIAVSHDRYFLDNIVDRIFAFEGNGHLTQYEGGYTDYTEALARKGGAVSEGQSTAVGAEKKKSAQADWKQNRPQKLKFTYKEQREFETIDDDIAALEELLEKLDKDMEANATNSVKLREIMEQKEKAQADLDEKMDRWVYLNDLAERIEAQKSEK